MAAPVTQLPQPKLSPQQINALARKAVLDQAINSWNQVAAGLIAAPVAGSNVINIAPRPTGFLKGFLIELTGTFTNTGSGAGATLTPWGLANLLSQVVFTDLSNQVRINTTGWHLHMVASAKRKRPFAFVNTLSNTNNNAPIGYGANYSLNSAAATLAQNATSTFRMFYWVPVTYADNDLRGGIFMAVTNATSNLQLTVNPTPFTVAGDPMTACYTGAAGTITNLSYTVYQNYLDQLPVGKGGYILPQLDMGTAYQLQNTTLTGVLAANDFPIPFPNFRTFLSTCLIYDNNAALNAATDINYFALQSANFTNFEKLDPFAHLLRARNEIGDDFPTAAYYFNHRHKPLATLQYGNLELIVNASSATSAACMVGWEMFATINLVTNAGSLPGG